MATSRKNLTAKPATRSKGLVLKSPGKGKPAAKKPSKPTSNSKAIVKPKVKDAPKPAARAGAKPVPKPKGAPVLNKGAAAAKALAEARAAAAAKAAEAAKRPPKLVPATPNAIRPGAARTAPAKGKSAPRPPAEVRPLGVLPPEAMARSKPAPVKPRVVLPVATPAPVRPAAPARAKGDDRLNEDDLKHFETRLLEERARIMREMGHLESTLLKVNPRDSAGEVGGYSFHMADAGTDAIEREKAFMFASAEGRMLLEINEALRRLYRGEYGTCESCGKAIARARLEAMPHARLCVECKEKEERASRGAQ